MTTGTISPWPLVRKVTSNIRSRRCSTCSSPRPTMSHVDGIFGPNTDAAVPSQQALHQDIPSVAVDGIVRTSHLAGTGPALSF